MQRRRAWVFGFLLPVACSVGVSDAAGQGFADPGDPDADDGDGEAEPSTSSASSEDEGEPPDLTGDASSESGDERGSSETGVPECADTLTDPLHCGACGHDCQGGGCSDGICQPVQLVAGVNMPWSLRVQGSRLFVGSEDGVFWIPLDGGERTIIAGGNVRGIVVDDERVYWVDALQHTISSAPVDGGPSELVVQFVTDPHPLESDGENLYWIDDGVMKRRKHDGVAAVIVPADGTGFVPWQLAVDDGRVYWRTWDGELRSADTDGGTDTLLAIGDAMHAVAVNSTHAFAMRRDGADNSNHVLLRMPKLGGEIEELIGGQPDVLPLLADEENVYWGTESGDPTRVLSMPVGGGTVRILAEFGGGNAIFTVHEDVVYWAAQDGGSISKRVL